MQKIQRNILKENEKKVIKSNKNFKAIQKS